jgi:hypothetical protein
LGLPHSKDERRSGDRLITAREGSPPWPCLELCTSATLCPATPHSVPAATVVGARSNRSRLREAGNRQMKPAISRAIAVVTTTFGLPVAAKRRYRAQKRSCAFQAMSRTAAAAPRGGREAYGSPEPTFGRSRPPRWHAPRQGVAGLGDAATSNRAPERVLARH